MCPLHLSQTVYKENGIITSWESFDFTTLPSQLIFSRWTLNTSLWHTVHYHKMSRLRNIMLAPLHAREKPHSSCIEYEVLLGWYAKRSYNMEISVTVSMVAWYTIDKTSITNGSSCVHRSLRGRRKQMLLLNKNLTEDATLSQDTQATCTSDLKNKDYG